MYTITQGCLSTSDILFSVYALPMDNVNYPPKPAVQSELFTVCLFCSAVTVKYQRKIGLLFSRYKYIGK